MSNISFRRCYCVGNETYANLQAAQRAALTDLLKTGEGTVNALGTGQVVDAIMANAAKVVDILTTTDQSRPAARKVNGGRKPRKKVVAAQIPLPGTSDAA